MSGLRPIYEKGPNGPYKPVVRNVNLEKGNEAGVRAAICDSQSTANYFRKSYRKIANRTPDPQFHRPQFHAQFPNERALARIERGARIMI
jgi:hypothetical protein